MKLTDTFSIHNLAVICLILSLGFVCVGCSSKTDKEEAARLRRENDELKKALAGAIEEKEQIQRHYDGLKKALAEAVGEKVQIQRRYDGLKRDLAGAIKGKEQIQRHYDELETDIAEVVEEEVQIQRRNDELQRDYWHDEDIDSIIAEFNSAISSEEQIELIKALSELSFGPDDPCMIGLVQRALDSPDPEVGRAAIGLLEDYETPDVLPVIKQALNSADAETRADALRSLSGVDDAQVSDLLAQALNDTSEDVRQAALEAVEWHEDDRTKLRFMREGIASEYDDVKYEVASMLEDRGDHSAVKILIEGLKDNDSAFREEVNASLWFLVDKEFGTYQEAQAWWNANKDNYDEDLFPKED